MSSVRRAAPTKRVTDVLRPYHILSCIIGARAINSNNRVKSKLGLIFPLFLSGYNIVGWILSQETTKKYDRRHMLDMVKYIYLIAVCLKILTIVASVIVGFLQSKLWERLKTDLDEVDKTLEALGSKARFRNIYIRTLIELAFFFAYALIIVFSLTYTSIIRTDKESLKIFGLVIFLLFYVYGEIVEYTVTMEFLTFIRCIRSEVQRVNDLLNDVNILPLSSIAMELMKYKETNKNYFEQIFTIAPSSERTYSRLLSTKNEIFRIRRLLRSIRQIHLELYKASKNVSRLYGIQMSLAMAMNVFYSTCFFYMIYSCRYHFKNGNILINEIISMNLSCLYITAKIILINYTCDKATQDTKKTGEIVHTFYAENADYEIQQEVKIFSIQMSHCHSAYSTFGLYSFNCKYICSFLRILTTYLVIMIQMSELSIN